MRMECRAVVLGLFVVLLIPPGTIVLAQAGRVAPRPAPEPRTVLDTPVEFAGWKGETVEPERLDDIRIGYFGPGDDASTFAGDAYRSAILAVELANEEGGLDGTPFRLVQRWAVDPWGAASKEMIHLIYKDSVWAVIGGVDGHTTHIAEQVSTKARLPLVSPISADPTLNYIRIPWMYRLPPNDERQADVLIRDGIQTSGRERIGMVTSVDHDGRIFAEAMRERMDAESFSPLFHFQVDTSARTAEAISARIVAFEPDGLVLRMPVEAALGLLAALQQEGFRGAVFVPWIPGFREAEAERVFSGPVYVVEPFGFEVTLSERFRRFENVFARRFGYRPAPASALAFDSVNMVIEGLRSSGLNRAHLRDALTALSGYEGASGRVEWDNAGGNTGNPVVVAPEGR